LDAASYWLMTHYWNQKMDTLDRVEALQIRMLKFLWMQEGRHAFNSNKTKGLLRQPPLRVAITLLLASSSTSASSLDDPDGASKCRREQGKSILRQWPACPLALWSRMRTIPPICVVVVVLAASVVFSGVCVDGGVLHPREEARGSHQHGAVLSLRGDPTESRGAEVERNALRRLTLDLNFGGSLVKTFMKEVVAPIARHRAAKKKTKKKEEKKEEKAAKGKEDSQERKEKKA